MRRFLTILIVLGIIGAGLVEWSNAAWQQPGPAARSGDQTVILIEPHTRLHDTVSRLQDAGVLNEALAFEFDLRLKGMASAVKAGEYAIPSKASMAQIAAILVSGKSIQHKLTAAEGLTSQMIVQLVENDKSLVQEEKPLPPEAEGMLLPETYLYTRGTTDREILNRMRNAQRKFLDNLWPNRTPGLPYTTQREAVILASIVEKETSLPEERRHIASVFVNRLRMGMPLQSDPTIIYALTRGYPLGHGMRQSELALDSPYNTYKVTGLPPGPICNPGKDSLAAVLNPAAGGDLYFVANGKGGHAFSDNIAAHARNVAAWRAIERVKAGLVPAPVVPSVHSAR